MLCILKLHDFSVHWLVSFSGFFCFERSVGWTWIYLVHSFGSLNNCFLYIVLPKIGQACRPVLKWIGFWDSIKELARGYEYMMGLIIFAPVAILSWFPFVSEFQTRLLFNQAFSRGLQISMILAGRKEKTNWSFFSSYIHIVIKMFIFFYRNS